MGDGERQKQEGMNDCERELGAKVKGHCRSKGLHRIPNIAANPVCFLLSHRLLHSKQIKKSSLSVHFQMCSSLFFILLTLELISSSTQMVTLMSGVTAWMIGSRQYVIDLLCRDQSLNRTEWIEGDW